MSMNTEPQTALSILSPFDPMQQVNQLQPDARDIVETVELHSQLIALVVLVATVACARKSESSVHEKSDGVGGREVPTGKRLCQRCRRLIP